MVGEASTGAVVICDSLHVTSTRGITEDMQLTLTDFEGKQVLVKVLQVDRDARTLLIERIPAIERFARHILMFDEFMRTKEYVPKRTAPVYGPVRSRGKGKVKRWS